MYANFTKVCYPVKNSSCENIPYSMYDQGSASALHSLIRLFPDHIDNNDPVDTYTAKREDSEEKTLKSLFECTVLSEYW